MTSRRVLRILLWAGALGLAVSLPTGGRQRISVELWLAALALWVLIGLVVALVRAAPPAGGRAPSLFPRLTRRIRKLLSFRRNRTSDERALNDHLFIEALVKRATTNERSHNRGLRPRLQAIVDHQLLLTDGIERTADPARAHVAQQELLGDLAWILDPAVTDRTPTLTELDHLLDRLTVGSDSF